MNADSSYAIFNGEPRQETIEGWSSGKNVDLSEGRKKGWIHVVQPLIWRNVNVLINAAAEILTASGDVQVGESRTDAAQQDVKSLVVKFDAPKMREA